jgi:hypothetical protein
MYVCETTFMYVCETTMFANTLSTEKIPEIKVVDIDEFYNFYIHNLFS